MSNQPGVSLHTVEQQFKCFQYTGNVDDGFPDIKFHFENSLSLTVYPREYLFQIRVSKLNLILLLIIAFIIILKKKTTVYAITSAA